MKIYTKTGDCGYTSLASGQRVSKTDPLIEAYGTVDELNSFVGLLVSRLDNQEATEQLHWIQNKLFNAGAALAQAEGEWIVSDDVHRLEQWMDAMQAELPAVHDFILPGGNEVVSLCHVCRTITRRAERQIVCAFNQTEKNNQSDEICRFMNRLSDFWFVFAQFCGKNAGISLFLWKK